MKKCKKNISLLIFIHIAVKEEKHNCKDGWWCLINIDVILMKKCLNS